MTRKHSFLLKLAVFYAMFCALLLATGKEARAASEWVEIQRTGYTREGAPVKAGDYYFRYEEKQSKSGTITTTVYRSEEEWGNEKIYTTKKGTDMHFYTNGKKLFITDNVSKKNRWYAWAAIRNIDGSGKWKVVMDERGRDFVGQAVCGDTLYFAWSKSSVKNIYNIYKEDYTTYAMKIGGKKVKKILKGYIPVKSNSTCVLLKNEKGKQTYSLYYPKTGKVWKLVSNISDTDFSFRMTDKAVFVISSTGDKTRTYIFYYKKIGKKGKAKKLGTMKNKGYLDIVEISDKAFTYYKSGHEYEYNFKTKKKHKLY